MTTYLPVKKRATRHPESHTQLALPQVGMMLDEDGQHGETDHGSRIPVGLLTGRRTTGREIVDKVGQSDGLEWSEKGFQMKLQNMSQPDRQGQNGKKNFDLALELDGSIPSRRQIAGNL